MSRIFGKAMMMIEEMEIDRVCTICRKPFHMKEPYVVMAEMDNVKDTCRIARYLCTGCYHDVCDYMKQRGIGNE